MSSLHRALFHTATKPCPACGEPTFRHAFTGATDEACALLGVQPDAEVCVGCADRAEQELDDAADALALDSDPDFVTVCDARRDGWIAAHELAERVVQCTHCGRWVPWYAVDTDGRCDRCPAARRAA